MLAYTGYWSRSHYLQTEREHAAREAKRLRDLRARHRKLPAWQRLLDDLDAVHAKMLTQERQGKHAPEGSPAREDAKRQMRRLLRHWNRLVERLNRFNGASQQVRLEEVS
jgi:Mg2+ and Co2+ transporter CorA